ncbi:MAG: hypothetical protein HGA39_02205 [Coriobacteriia bacterium]|nr:hypothetical protein [Coriobacteriia bacterium]
MAIAAWCAECGQYVWLGESGGCANGHPASACSKWYDPATGQPVDPPIPAAAPAEAAPAVSPAANPVGTRLGFLADVLAAFSAHQGYTAAYGTDTDLAINNVVAAASWGLGKKKVEYSAIMKAVEPERTVYFWEMLKEKGGGASFGGFESESYTTFGKKRSGTKKETVFGPDGKVLDYSWDYAETREIVEQIAARHGFKVKVVLRKGSAQY